MPASVEDILSQMTLDEKIAQLGSYWMYDLQTTGELDMQKVSARLKDGIGQISRVAGASMLDPVNAARATNCLQKFLIQDTRLGIPAIVHEECCSGAMILGGTIYPQMIGLASSFQPELAEAMTTAIRRQMRAIGAHQGLAPLLDVSRDPRWGRVEETFGEDPTLVGHFGMAYIRGLQGENLKEGVMATGKHFIGHSLSEGGLNCAPVHMGMRDVYDIFLGPFQAAIRDAGLASIMNSYPELDGEVVAASRRILTELLRDKLGFDGLLVSDYEAVRMLHTYHACAKDLATAGKLALEAGIDVELPTVTCYGEPLKAALEAGSLNLETIDLAVRRHLRKKFELGLFENPYVDEGRVLEIFETPENRRMARQIARQSMVLLKNDGLLPLKKTIGTLAVIGPNANDGRSQLGDYSYPSIAELMRSTAPENSAFHNLAPDGPTDYGVCVFTVLDGIRDKVSPQTQVLYAQGCEVMGADRSGFDEALEITRKADAVLLVLGDRSGMTPNCSTGETRDSDNLHLSGLQEELARAVIATGKPVAAVLVNGRPFALPWLAEHVHALLEAWLPGEEGGNAIADILFGDANPGGKLPISFPRSVGQVPIFYNHKPSGMHSNWYVDYVNEKVTPLYPFGHGLSYTSFDFADLSIDRQQAAGGESVAISLRVSNIGSMTGEEVVQLYVCDEFASMPRPVKELKGYQRLALKPGESKRLTFRLPVDQLAFYDADLNLVLEPGTIQLMLGSSSDDIRLRSTFEIVGGSKIEVKQRVFVCPVEIQ
jgi:beta-glucosidase